MQSGCCSLLLLFCSAAHWGKLCHVPLGQAVGNISGVAVLLTLLEPMQLLLCLMRLL
jgi:hypothetical protein